MKKPYEAPRLRVISVPAEPQLLAESVNDTGGNAGIGYGGGGTGPARTREKLWDDTWKDEADSEN